VIAMIHRDVSDRAGDLALVQMALYAKAQASDVHLPIEPSSE